MAADWRIHRVVTDVPVADYWDYWSVQREMIEELRVLGATFFRMMLFPASDILVVEGWREQPDDQGPEPTLEDVIGFGT